MKGLLFARGNLICCGAAQYFSLFSNPTLELQRVNPRTVTKSNPGFLQNICSTKSPEKCSDALR